MQGIGWRGEETMERQLLQLRIVSPKFVPPKFAGATQLRGASALLTYLSIVSYMVTMIRRP